MLSSKIFYAAFLLLPLASQAQNVFPSSGNVGIGTSTPNQRLHVSAGNFRLTDPGPYPYGMNIDMNYTGSWAREFSFSYGSTGKLLAFGAYCTNGNVNYGYIGGNTTADIVYQAPWLVFKPDGDVGIGTTAPGSMHNINQASFTTYNASDKVLSLHSSNMPVLELSRPAGSTNGLKVGAVYFTNTLNQSDAHRQIAGLWAENVQHPSYPDLSGGKIVFMTKPIGGAAQLKMIFDEKGNLCLGTSNPKNYKLAVEGIVGARKVKVTQESWADFVFDPGYRLPSLQELEQYIREHRHLPDIPTEQEVLAEGIDLGEMNKKLLQKVEELTLHVIDLNNRLKALENK